MNVRFFYNRFFVRARKLSFFLVHTAVRATTLVLLCALVSLDIGPLLQWPPAPPQLRQVEAAILPAIKVESFDQNVTTDGSIFTLTNDVGDISSAFIRMNTGTRKTGAGPTGSTANTGPDIGTVGLVLTGTDEVTVKRANATEVKVMGEVWRYQGTSGGEHEFIVRDRVAVSLSGSLATQAISGIVNIDKVIPFITGYTVNDSSVSSWEDATIAAHIDDSGDLLISRNNSGSAATVYVDVVEFTGSAWNVCHGYSNNHDTAEETVSLNTDSDGQGGSVCDVGDWSTATIIEATMEGDSSETGLSDTLALVRPGANTTSVVFDVQQDTGARNDGEAWIHVLQNDDLVVHRAANADVAEGNGTYGQISVPSGVNASAALDTLSLEWFTDTSGVGTAHMRGGLHARIITPTPIVYNDGDLVPSTDYDSTLEANYVSELTFAATPSGVVYEAGGTGTGSFVGYNDAGDFIIRAGNGGSTAPADAARIVITTSDYDFSGRAGTLSWNFYPNTETVDLSFDEGSDGSVEYATSTAAAAAWANWSGGDDGYVGNASASIAGSEIASGFDFNGTITEARFSQGGKLIEHWIHRDGNNVGIEYGVIELAGLTFDNTFFGFDTLVTATGTHISTTDIPSNDVYVGGTFVVREGTASRNVTNITITESGAIDGATGLSDIELWYDVSTTSPYDCSEHSFDGNETQFGSADGNGFSGANGVSSFTDAVQITTTRSLCVYPVMSVTEGASDGETIAISIDDATTDVNTTGGGSVGSPSFPQVILGSTTVQNAELTQIHYHWREDDGSESGASSVSGIEDVPAGGFQAGTQRRLRIAVSAEGSSDADPAQFRLQYAEKAGTCAAATGWEDVADVGGAWDIGDSPSLSFGDSATNILSAALGAVSDEEFTFNGASTIVDGGDKSVDVQIDADAFAELEYTVLPTNTATEGATYCFRLVDETPDVTHGYRIPLSIQSSQVDSTLTNFPVYVDLNTLGAHFFSMVKSDGSDIRVTASDGTTEVPREVVAIDTGTNTGELHFQAPSISSSVDTTFYIYYGATSENEYQASSTYGSRAVWNANYEAVYHYDDTPAGSASILDSTRNANHGTSQGGMSGSSLTTGRMGQGYDFSGGNYYIDFPQLVAGNSQMTVSYWIDNPSYNDGRAFSSGGSGTGQVLIWPDDLGGLECMVDGARATSNLNPSGWAQHACTYDGATVQNYANSTPAGSAGKTGNIATVGTGDLFGVDGGASLYLSDTVDELRVMNIAVSADWLESEYANQTNPSTFYATSTYETLSNPPVSVAYDVYPEANITADITVSSFGNQVASLNAGSSNQYVGGTFEVVRDGTSRTLTSITIAETGTVDATQLTSPRLYYDLAADCSLESYAPSDSFIAGTAFSSANGTSTFVGSVAIDSSQSFCGYVVFDVSTVIANGETINIEIENPSTDVVVTSSTVGPSSPIGPIGSTTVLGSVLTQMHYHWRNDDGDEDEATSATAGVEDVPLADVPKQSPRRLRIGVSNEGLVTSQPTQYRLEYATKVTSCELVYSWTDVGEIGGAWDMAASGFVADGNTTNFSTSTLGALTDEATTFTGLGALRETTAESGAITLDADEFTELEYVIESTENSGYATDYCFRVTAAGAPITAYNIYPELTTREKQDFFVQRGTLFVTGTDQTLVAGVDYVPPAATSSAFVRITNSNYTGAGVSFDADSNFNPDDVTAYISDQEDITSSFTISRPPAAVGDTRVSWEIIEYTGLSGADNEMIVRDVGTVTYAGTSDTATGSPVSAVADAADVVVFITGQYNPGASTNDWMEGLSTSAWNATTSEPVFSRGQTGSIAARVSYAVVEYTGQNWKVQRAEHTYSSTPGTTEATSISPVNSLLRSFIHPQKRVAGASTGLDDYGQQVWLSSIGALSLQLNSGNDVAADNTAVVWVIENTQTSDGAINVYRVSGSVDANEAVEPRTTSVAFGSTVGQISNVSLSISNDSTGPGAAYPRPILGATVASTTHFELFEADAGQTQEYRVEIIEWPVADVAVRQNYYRFYVDNGVIDPNDPWPVGVVDLGENTSVTAVDDPLGEGGRVRLRMTLAVSNATLPAGVAAFKLQYGLRTTSCSAIGTWSDVGGSGSGSIWRGYDNTPADGVELATSTPAAGRLNLSVADVAGTYEEDGFSAVNPYAVNVGEDVEYDWLIEHNGAAQRSDYCFRMVYSDDTPLTAYNNYPTLRTTGYTPVVGNWRWYGDEGSLTPVTPLANENTAPIDVPNNDIIKLRVTAAEVENAAGSNVKFLLQYSEYADFADGGTTLTATSTCEADSFWCYADSAGVDNATIDAATLSDADACVAGVGVGCGTHNEAATTTSSLTHAAASKVEVEFALKHAGARANAVYYFRLIDAATEDVLIASSSYPSLVTEGPTLTSTLSSVSSGAVVAGVEADVDTTPTSIPFGSLPIGTSYEAIHQLSINTNATQGYQLFVRADSQLTNQYGDIIEPITATNDTPVGWDTACGGAVSCFGYHTTDATLSKGSTRFAPEDSYAHISTTTAEEIMYSSVPTNDIHNIIYRIYVTGDQPAGQYEASIMYISVPVF
jgi:hypothetical protein